MNEKRIGRLMKVMDLEAIYCKPGTSVSGTGHEIYPYLLRHKAITGPDQVWCADITYIPMKHGFMYLMAVMDWWSRFVLAWELSNTLDAAFMAHAHSTAPCSSRSSSRFADDRARSPLGNGMPMAKPSGTSSNALISSFAVKG